MTVLLLALAGGSACLLKLILACKFKRAVPPVRSFRQAGHQRPGKPRAWHAGAFRGIGMKGTHQYPNDPAGSCEAIAGQARDRPLPKFDPSRLDPLEKRAWAAVVDGCGHGCVEEMFACIAYCAVKRIDEGWTTAEICDNVIGSFYDHVPLMRLGQTPRNQTIILAKAIVKQAIDDFRPTTGTVT
jgi:hypothetical protein